MNENLSLLFRPATESCRQMSINFDKTVGKVQDGYPAFLVYQKVYNFISKTQVQPTASALALGLAQAGFSNSFF